MKHQKSFLYGIFSMGLIVNWILFIPYYGPGLAVLNINNRFLPHIFTLTHIVGLVLGSWLLFRISGNKIICRLNRLTPFTTAFLTVAFIYLNNIAHPIMNISIFTVMGIFSGLIVSRWMTWFSSAVTVSNRGNILGKSIGITYTFLYFNIMVISIPDYGVIYSFVISSMALLIGGLMSNQLPVPVKQGRTISTHAFVPAADLLLFGVFAYTTVSLIYHSTIQNQMQNLNISWLVLIPYIMTGLLLGKWSDKHDRYYFAIFAFFVIGLGFLIHSIHPIHSIYNTFVGVLILSGLLCIHLFYWLSLVDRQNINDAPFPFVIGVSIELVSCAAVFSILPFISPSPSDAGKVVGITGVVFILIGFFVTSFYNYRGFATLKKAINTREMRLNRQVISFHKGYNDLNMPLFFYFHNVDKKVIEQMLIQQFNFTNRETEIAYLKLIGFKNSNIIELLNISPNTLKYHIKNIYSKIGASSLEETSEIVYTLLQTQEKVES